MTHQVHSHVPLAYRPLRVRAARLLLVLALAALAGCVGPPPQPLPARIVQAPVGDLQLAEVRGGVAQHLGAPVRWGGTVVSVERDGAGNARVQVVQRQLDSDGRPLPGSASDGRFLILAAPDVNPDLYAPGAELTVAGTLADEQTVRIGERAVNVPRVQVEVFQRWEPLWLGSPYDDPYYHPGYGHPYGHPWYGPRVHFGVGLGHHPYGWYRGGLHPWWW
jgi:outer membrane lipoprotein